MSEFAIGKGSMWIRRISMVTGFEPVFLGVQGRKARMRGNRKHQGKGDIGIKVQEGKLEGSCILC